MAKAGWSNKTKVSDLNGYNNLWRKYGIQARRLELGGFESVIGHKEFVEEKGDFIDKELPLDKARTLAELWGLTTDRFITVDIDKLIQEQETV